MVVGAPYGLAYSMSVGWISARWPANTIFPTCPWPSSYPDHRHDHTGTPRPVQHGG